MNTLQHIAFIPDGNRRFGKASGESAISGHQAGAETIKMVIEVVREEQIPFVTFYAFSTENWKRSKEEVSALMNLFRDYFLELQKSTEEKIQIKFIGRRNRLPHDVLLAMQQVEEKSINNPELTVCLAIDYGGQDELVRVFQKILWQVLTFRLNPFQINIDNISNLLDTVGMPSPDLIIRSSGEQRLSGFLLWQSAYSEILFTPELWPALTKERLKEMIIWYRKGDRRFGA